MHLEPLMELDPNRSIPEPLPDLPLPARSAVDDRPVKPGDLPLTDAAALDAPPMVEVGAFNLHYGNKQALHDINLTVRKNTVMALIGPSGCGKSTLLRSINRMNDLIDGIQISGSVTVGGQDIYAPGVDVITLRKRMGMVFQKSNPFPKSIFENVAYGLRVQGEKDKAVLEEAVERSLMAAGLWDEVKDRLKDSGLGLSGGQQQRLCIARALAVEPEVLLMDEPASALDPIATQKIEELILNLSKELTIIIVTHNMQQAARVSDLTAFFYMGQLIEVNKTDTLFTKPELKQTEAYITGRFG